MAYDENSKLILTLSLQSLSINNEFSKYVCLSAFTAEHRQNKIIE